MPGIDIDKDDPLCVAFVAVLSFAVVFAMAFAAGLLAKRILE